MNGKSELVARQEEVHQRFQNLIKTLGGNPQYQYYPADDPNRDEVKRAYAEYQREWADVVSEIPALRTGGAREGFAGTTPLHAYRDFLRCLEDELLETRGGLTPDFWESQQRRLEDFRRQVTASHELGKAFVFVLDSLHYLRLLQATGHLKVESVEYLREAHALLSNHPDAPPQPACDRMSQEDAIACLDQLLRILDAAIAAKWETETGESDKLDERNPAGAPTALRPAGYLGLLIDEANQRVRCDGSDATVEFSRSPRMWGLFRLLLPNRTTHLSLEGIRAAWPKFATAEDPEDGTIYDAISDLRGFMKPLGIGIESVRKDGYRLIGLPKVDPN